MEKRTRKNDDMQAENLALQEKLAPKSRFADLFLIGCFVLFLFGFALAGAFLPDETFSEQENRYLQSFPALSSRGKFLDRFFNGKFTSEFADYLSDQFPLRNAFVGIKAASEIALMKQENNGVILGKDGYLIKREDYPNAEYLEKNLSAAKAFALFEREKGIPVSFAFAGRTVDVMRSALPPSFDENSNQWLYSKIDGVMGDESYLDLCAVLQEKADHGEEVAYRTDHHWTSLGAFYAYRALGDLLGYEPFALSDFERVTVSDGFLGTTWSSAGMKWISPEKIEFFRYPGDQSITTEIVSPNGKSFPAFYDESFLAKKDKYSAFLSGNNPLVRITGEGEREKLLLIKDSFSHSLAPFLARHFDLVLVDLRYYSGDVDELINSEGIDRVLILYNVSNLASDTSLSTLA